MNNNYVLMQVADPGHCYDPTLPNYSVFVAAESTRPTPDLYRGYPGTIQLALRNQMVNFFNVFDYALATGVFALQKVHWEENQVAYKPDIGRFGFGSDGTIAYQDRGVRRQLTDPREIMSFVSRPRSKAVGALSGVRGAIAGEEIDLAVDFGFRGDRVEHSAQFHWNIQRLWNFYRQLGVSLGVLAPAVP